MPATSIATGDDRGSVPGSSDPGDELALAWTDLVSPPDSAETADLVDELPAAAGLGDGRADPELHSAGGIADDVLESLELSSDPASPPQGPSLNPFGLDEQEIKFVYGYLLGWSLADCATYAGFQGGSSTGAKIRDRSHVWAEIQRHQRANVPQLSNGQDFRYTVGDLMSDMRSIIQANIVDALTFDNDGKPRMKLVSQMPHAVRRAIKKIKIGPKGDIEIELYDKLSAMRMLSAALGLRPKMPGPEDPPEGAEPEIIPPQSNSPTTIERMVTTQTVSFERIAKDNSDAIKRAIVPSTIDGA